MVSYDSRGNKEKSPLRLNITDKVSDRPEPNGLEKVEEILENKVRELSIVSITHNDDVNYFSAEYSVVRGEVRLHELEEAAKRLRELTFLKDPLIVIRVPREEDEDHTIYLN